MRKTTNWRHFSPGTVLDLRDGFWAARGIFQMGCRERFKLEQRAALLGKEKKWFS
jgi:hypothetical protein